MQKPVLLSVVEIGGYPNFTPLYQKAGYDVVVETRMRKTLGAIKKLVPRVVVAEFNYQSDFRDRTSSLESMMSVVECLPDTRVVVFYEKEYSHQLERLLAACNIHRTFAFPVSENDLYDCLCELAGDRPD